jgi:predicted anti-sigma-YlaC factor YlaD
MLFMRCREAAALISHAMDRPLPPEDGAALHVHLAICPACRRYRGQLALLRRVLRLVEIEPPAGVRLLSPEARTRIHLSLERRQRPY